MRIVFRSLTPGEVACPGEGEEGDGCDVVDKHFHKILPLHISELRNGEGPVEGELYHVVPPDGRLDIMVRIIIPIHNENTNIIKLENALRVPCRYWNHDPVGHESSLGKG